MKLEKVILKNFRGYRNETVIPISSLTAFIGKNDAGKSTVLEALEIFFNNKLVVCEREDLNINADSNQIQITCVFSNLPNEIVIDAAAPTSLQNEHLLNNDNHLQIKKVFLATAAKPKEIIYMVCIHPTVENGSDLLTLKRTELRARANELGVSPDDYNGNVNSSIREAIWNSFDELSRFSSGVYFIHVDDRFSRFVIQ